jgi:short-subunit dehydrogenase
MKEVAIVTGASKGVGRSVAHKLAEMGKSVVLIARREDELMSVAKEIKTKGGEVDYIAIDLCQDGAVESVVYSILERYGRIDLLINNAARGGMASIEKISLKLWNNILKLNLTVPFEFANLVLPQMKERNQGMIVNISSEASLNVTKYLGAYGVSKVGLNKLTTQIDVEYRDYGIKAYAICPGWIDTSLAVDPALVGVGREEILKPEDIADAVEWLVIQPSNVRMGPIIPIVPRNSKANLMDGVNAYIEENKLYK